MAAASYVRSITDDHSLLPGVAALSGAVYLTLVCAASAVEVAYAATADRVTDLSLLTLAGWLYQFALEGFAFLVGAVSLAAWRSRTLPRWLVVVGAVVIVALLLRRVLPFVAPAMLVVWLLLISAALIRTSSEPGRSSLPGDGPRRGAVNASASEASSA